MIEKALVIIIFMYAVSFSVYGAQYVLGDVFGVTLVSYQGTVLKPYITTFLNEDQINTVTSNIVTSNYTANSTAFDKIETFSVAAAYVAWELVSLLSGTYIFNFIYLMGVPQIFVVPVVVLYLILLARAIIGYIRGV